MVETVARSTLLSADDEEAAGEEAQPQPAPTPAKAPPPPPPAPTAAAAVLPAAPSTPAPSARSRAATAGFVSPSIASPNRLRGTGASGWRLSGCLDKLAQAAATPPCLGGSSKAGGGWAPAFFVLDTATGRLSRFRSRADAEAGVPPRLEIDARTLQAIVAVGGGPPPGTAAASRSAPLDAEGAACR